MSATFNRAALVYHGFNPASEVAGMEIDWRGDRTLITWADVMRNRRERQARRLETIAHVERWRPMRVWVAYFDQSFFGGWQAFIGDFRGCFSETWIDRDGLLLRPILMDLFPLVLPFGRDEGERFEDWKEAFARIHRRGTHHRRPRGSAFFWRKGREVARDPRP